MAAWRARLGEKASETWPGELVANPPLGWPAARVGSAAQRSTGRAEAGAQRLPTGVGGPGAALCRSGGASRAPARFATKCK